MPIPPLAVDMLLFDLMAQQAGEPLYKTCMGGFRTSIPTSITIGILPVQETAERAKSFDKGFRCKTQGRIRLEKMWKSDAGSSGEKVGNRNPFDANQGIP